MPDDQLIDLKDRAADQFLRIPGVTGVGLGGRERGGRPTGEVVLKVFVTRKRSPSELTPGETLPPQFEGIGVDVVEMPEGEEDGAPVVPPPPGSPTIPLEDRDEKKYRPARGGGRVQVALTGSTGGTLGCLLLDTADPNKIYALTNYHVLAPKGGPTPIVNSTRVGQPTDFEGPTKCCSDLIGTYAGGNEDTIRDAALIRLDPGTEWLAEITDIGPVAGVHTVTMAEAKTLTYEVRKRGERTGLTGGTVQSINTVDTTDGTTRKNVMIVKPNPNPAVPAGQIVRFSDKGDSGAAVVNSANEVVGVHFAGSGATATVRNGKEIPIADVIAQFHTVEKLSVAVATATTNGVVNTVPGVAPVAGPQALEPAPAVGAPASLALPLDGIPSFSAAFARVGQDLDASAAGRELRALWIEHAQEILGLVNHRRRVTVAWHRGGGPALMQLVARMSADQTLQMPATINGEPPLRRIERITAVLHANASPELRRALDHALAALPDPARLTYNEVLIALAARGGG